MERRGRREVALVVVGVVLHSLYMLSIFDIYFKSPIVSGMDPEPLGIVPPANRLVLFISDGMRADKFFEMDPNGKPRAPYLHNIMHNKGRWGVSHARPPTESRPGHVAIIAGFYEDPSAVTKGWKANPVEFDSVFNRSRHTVAFGSPDIVPIFCSALPHAYTDSYSAEFEDFATDASFLDEWAFERLEKFLRESKADSQIQNNIKDDGLIVFLHLLGCDTNGHAHRPFSDIYLQNINLVDRGIESTVKLMEEYFPDGKTAYLFTSDHGMSNKGSHGDGDPQNTETPIVVWGSGVRGPEVAHPEDDVDDGVLFIDQHTHHEKTPDSWRLKNIERTDINQGDIAPLMSTLLGLPCPLNSVGSLPVEFLALDKKDQAKAMFGNAKQVLDQALRKSQLKQATSLFFKPFSPLVGYKSTLFHIDESISGGQFESALQSSQELIRVALEGLHYFQTYDWFFLMSTVILGYLGWMVYVFLHILQSYTTFLYSRKKDRRALGSASGKRPVRLAGGLFFGACSVLLLFQRSPPLYHAYLGLAVFFWTEIFASFTILQNLARVIQSSKISLLPQLIITSLISFLVLELLVASFFRREVYTVIFLVAGIVGAVVVSCNMRDLSMVPAFVWVSCWFLSGFTLMPTQISDNTALVVGSGVVLVALAIFGRFLDYMYSSDPSWKLKFCGTPSKSEASRILFWTQIILVLVASSMVWITTEFRAEKKGLPLFHQITNWSLAVVSILLPVKSSPAMLPRLISIFLGFAPPFLLLSIGYEALFYTALGLVLLAWILVESMVCHSIVPSPSPKWERSNSNYLPEPTGIRSSKAALSSIELQHTRVALCFTVLGTADTSSISQVRFVVTLNSLSPALAPAVFIVSDKSTISGVDFLKSATNWSWRELVLINVAFFGTGNMASVASFEISSVYRFITKFDPFIMGALLLCKIFIPFILVTCAFSAVTRLLELPRLGCYFVVLLLSDVMTIHFFFLVKNTGSWLDIGQSISHFGIMSAQVVFVLLLFAVSSVFTNDLDLLSSEERASLSRLQTANNLKYQ